MFLKINKETLINTAQTTYLKFVGCAKDEHSSQQLTIYADKHIFPIYEEEIDNFMKLNHRLIIALHQPVRDALLHALREANVPEWEVER